MKSIGYFQLWSRLCGVVDGIIKPLPAGFFRWPKLMFGLLSVVVSLALPPARGFQQPPASLTLNVPHTGTEGTTLLGTLTLDVVAAEPITVNLFSENTNRVRVPSFVIIPPGTNAAQFD